jgi:RNA polymerase sigma-70 factor (ECF subfamily)
VTGAPDDAQAGFEEEALPHLDAVYRFALRLSGTPDAAEDLVQETFLRAFRSWDRFTRGTAAKSWLFTICRNVFLRGVERSNRHDTIVLENAGRSGAGLEPASPVWASVIGTDPEGEFFGSIVDEQVIRAIDALPEDFRTPVVLSDVEGLSYAEMAQLLGVPIGTVKSRLFRGRRQLQAALYEYAVEMGYLSGPRAGATQEDERGS